MKKAIQYAYPTSKQSADLNEGINGCYYVTQDEVDPLKPDARISCTAIDLPIIKHLANLTEGEFFEYCGEVQDGRQFPA